MTIREKSFRESDHPGIVFPGNVSSRNKTVRETSFRETSFREKNHPGKLLSGKRPYTSPPPYLVVPARPRYSISTLSVIRQS